MRSRFGDWTRRLGSGLGSWGYLWFFLLFVQLLSIMADV